MHTSRQAKAAAAGGAGPDALAATDAALQEVSASLDGHSVTLAVVFLGGDYAPHAAEVRGAVASRLEPATLIGVSAQGVVAGGAEIESGSSISIWAASLPGATCFPMRCSPPADRDAPTEGWPEPPEGASALIAFADPHTFPADAFVAWLGHLAPGLPVSGGLASGSMQPGGNRLLLDDVVYTDGAVGVALGGDLAVQPLVSQGCRPVGPSYVITAAERNVIAELGGRPATERLHEIYGEASEADRKRMEAGLHIGLVVDEYAEEYDTGDFLVRNLLGADSERGAIAVGDLVAIGQTVRFHVRDAESAHEDLRRLLDRQLGPPAAAAGLLFTCNGRGRRLFGEPDHDASLVYEALGKAPLAGFFAAGELGPVGGRPALHGFTASVLTVSTSEDQQSRGG